MTVKLRSHQTVMAVPPINMLDREDAERKLQWLDQRELERQQMIDAWEAEGHGHDSDDSDNDDNNSAENDFWEREDTKEQLKELKKREKKREKERKAIRARRRAKTRGSKK